MSRSATAVIPELELEWFRPPQPEPECRTQSVRFGWIGSGTCGGRLAETFYQLGYPAVLAIHTSAGELDGLDLPEENKFLMEAGEEVSGDMDHAGEAVETCAHDLFGRMEDLFSDQVDHWMICLGAGGGVGGGSVLRLIEMARNYARLLDIANRSSGWGC